MKKTETKFHHFMKNLTLELFKHKDSFEMARAFGEHVLRFARFDSALLIWPEPGSSTPPTKVEKLGKHRVQPHQKVYSTRFLDQDDIFFRIEFYYSSKKNLTPELKHHILQAEAVVKEAITANEIRLKKEEVDRFMWMRHLSAGLSHELNTPLTTLLFYTSKILKDTPENPSKDPIKNSLSTIEKVLGHYKIMSGDGQFVDLEVWKVQDVFTRLQAKMEDLFPDHFKLMSFSLKECDGSIAIQYTDIESILQILVKNSIEALDEVDAPEIKISARITKGKFSLSVCDNGKGIRPEHRPYVFAPSYTTKDINQGSGFGLSLARAMAFLNDGSLRLNALSEKTQFVLEIPLKETKKARKVA